MKFDKGQLTVAIAVFLGFSLLAEAQQANTLESLRTAYDKATAQIAADTQRQKDDALVQYGKALDTVIASLKQKGDIDSYGVVDAERKRFQSEKVVLANAPDVHFAEAVYAYRTQVQAIEADKDRRMDGLLRQYITALNGLIKDLMAKDKIDDAKTAGDVKKSAEFELAEIESTIPKVEPPKVKPAKKLIPKDAKAFNGHHYLVVIKTVSWHQAKKECEDMGGHLVIIRPDKAVAEDSGSPVTLKSPGLRGSVKSQHTPDPQVSSPATGSKENEFVKSLANHKRLWIGCTNEKKQDEWVWVDGTKMTWSDWYKGHPDNRGGIEHWGTLWNHPVLNDHWTDAPVSDPDVVGYICEWDY